MKLKNIALDNIKRRKSKGLFLIIGMMIGIATIVTIYNVTVQAQADIEQKIDEFGANIMVIPKSNTLSMTYGGITIPGTNYDIREIQEKEIENIWTIENSENLSIVSPKILGAAEVNSELVLIVGADLATEVKLKKWWQFEEGSSVEFDRKEIISPIDPSRLMVKTIIKGLKKNDIIIGSRVAAKLGLGTGDSVICRKDDESKKVTVRAVIKETGSQDDSIIFMNLETAQVLLEKKGKISLVEVAALCAGCPVEDMATQINRVIPNGNATPIKQVVEQKMQTIRELSQFGFLLGIIIILIGSLIVFTTMSASVNERQREIGIFRAIGFRRSHVMRIIFTETAILSVISGIAGYFFGIGSSILINYILGNSNLFLFDPKILAASIGISVCVGLAATIYPAFYASKIDPSVALRHI